jgi:hypothetical protein
LLYGGFAFYGQQNAIFRFQIDDFFQNRVDYSQFYVKLIEAGFCLTKQMNMPKGRTEDPFETII